MYPWLSWEYIWQHYSRLKRGPFLRERKDTVGLVARKLCTMSTEHSQELLGLFQSIPHGTVYSYMQVYKALNLSLLGSLERSEI